MKKYNLFWKEGPNDTDHGLFRQFRTAKTDDTYSQDCYIKSVSLTVNQAVIPSVSQSVNQLVSLSLSQLFSQSVMSKSWESHEKSLVIHEKVMKKLRETHEKVIKKQWERNENVLKKSWEIHEQVTRKSTEIIRKY